MAAEAKTQRWRCQVNPDIHSILQSVVPGWPDPWCCNLPMEPIVVLPVARYEALLRLEAAVDSELPYLNDDDPKTRRRSLTDLRAARDGGGL